MQRQSTKYTADTRDLTAFSRPPGWGGAKGLFVLPCILDLVVGEEVVLCWLDRTPFVHELAKLTPFQLSLLSGFYISKYGPLIWMLFHVPAPGGKSSEPFASIECQVNPSNPREMALWRRLANQTHWHLTLIGADDKVVNSFEFENNYGLEEGLQTMMEACRGHRTRDFARARREFRSANPKEDLHAMIE